MSHHLKAWERTVQPRINKTMVRNHSSCLNSDQDPLQVIRLKNPEKIWLFLLLHLSRLCLVVYCACLETDLISASSDFSATSASDFNISNLTSLLRTALAELKSLKELQHLIQPKIDEVVDRLRDIRPHLTETAFQSFKWEGLHGRKE
jgi:hypothetical protein